ncbi:MAG: hypothetical protein ACR2GK_12565 [Gemmatimonadaceae bacterium]
MRWPTRITRATRIRVPASTKCMRLNRQIILISMGNLSCGRGHTSLTWCRSRLPKRSHVQLRADLET